MNERDHNTMKSKAESIGLNWPRMFGVAVEVYEDDWDTVQEMIEDCLDHADSAKKDGKDPQAIARTYLIQCLTEQIEDLLDDGYYDYEQ